MAADNRKDPRNTVINMLSDTLVEGIFSDAVLESALGSDEYDNRDMAFIRHLYTGVLERLIYLDYCINRFSNTPTVKMKTVVLNILRISVYQMLFMDSVPDYAVLNEASRLAAKRGLSGLGRFVNGVLRSIQAGKDDIGKDMPANISLSVPKWIYEMLVQQFGNEQTESFLSGTLENRRFMTIKANTARMTAEEVAIALENEGCTVQMTDEEDGILWLSGFDSLTELDAFKYGLFSVQDERPIRAALAGCRALDSMHCSPSLIVDVCAAPGGKSICAAEHFPEASVISRDISEKKRLLIEENARRLGLANIRSEVHDALEYDDSMTRQADLVIADLPCSGIGVIGKKPDIKFRLRKKDIPELAELQKEILKTVQGYVRSGGILVYSTCTVTDEENAGNTRWFLENYDFEPVNEEQILPEDGDGFYTAVFRKR